MVELAPPSISGLAPERLMHLILAHKCQKYVKSNIALIEEAVREIRNKNMTPIHRNAFTKFADEVPMLE